MTWAELSTALSQPFSADAISFRAGSVSRDKKRAQALAYAEPRCYEDRLNDVLGSDWGCRFITWGEQRLICELTVTVEQPDGTRREVVRTSTGEFDASDKIAQGTSAEAQAFKRACSKFGLGRYLYDLPTMWVGYDENSRRLTETPAPPTARARSPRSAPVATTERPAARAGTISGKRAEVMEVELKKLGVSDPLKFARGVLKTRVNSLGDLTEDEAMTVWNAAKRIKR